MAAGTRRVQGFTLLELIVVLAIGGILLTVGVPGMQSFMEGQRRIASHGAVVSVLHLARSEAAKRLSSVQVSLAQVDDRWQLDVAEMPSGEMIKQRVLPISGAQVPVSGWRVSFNDMGRRDECAATGCMLEVSRNPSRWVHVDWTGRIDPEAKPEDADE